MKVILLKDKDLGLSRIRKAGEEMDVDPASAEQWIADKEARLSEKELLEQAAAKKVNLISKPAEPKPAAPADAEGKAKS